jgi:hypothetical protein
MTISSSLGSYSRDFYVQGEIDFEGGVQQYRGWCLVHARVEQRDHEIYTKKKLSADACRIESFSATSGTLELSLVLDRCVIPCRATAARPCLRSTKLRALYSAVQGRLPCRTLSGCSIGVTRLKATLLENSQGWL